MVLQQAHQFAGEALPFPCLYHPSGAYPLQLEHIDGKGFFASCEAPLLAGQEITINLPGVGSVDARILTAGRHHFRAEFAGSTALRVRFLAGWRDRATRAA